MKICTSCKIEKPLDAFHKANTRSSFHAKGRQSHCKRCFHDRYAKNPIQNRRAWIKSGYGLDWTQYEEMFRQQRGRCLICDREILLYERDKLHVAHVDHDHETGETRGLLCHFCNSGLGYFKDDPELLELASAYLEYFKAKGKK